MMKVQVVIIAHRVFFQGNQNNVDDSPSAHFFLTLTLKVSLRDVTAICLINRYRADFYSVVSVAGSYLCILGHIYLF